ncbi:MAG: DUF6263 family protein [Cyanobacteria bacterium P01_A01_bin.45]
MKKLVIGGIACVLVNVTGSINTIAVSQETPRPEEKIEQRQTPDKTKDTAKPFTLAKPTIKILQYGSEPKQKLRLKPVAGTEQKSTMTLDMNMSMSVKGRQVPNIKLPGTLVNIDTKVTKVEPNGDVYYEFVYSDIEVTKKAEVQPELVKAMESKIKQLKGIKGEGIIDERGNTKKIDIDLTQLKDPTLKPMLEQLSNSLSQMSSSIPNEAVGVGAQWLVTNQITSNGINITQLETYELISIENGVATTKVTLEQQGKPNQEINLPGLPKGAKVTLKSYSGSGEGESQFGLGRLMPIKSVVNMNSNVQMSAKPRADAKETMMNQKIIMKMSIESK